MSFKDYAKKGAKVILIGHLFVIILVAFFIQVICATFQDCTYSFIGLLIPVFAIFYIPLLIISPLIGFIKSKFENPHRSKVSQNIIFGILFFFIDIGISFLLILIIP